MKQKSRRENDAEVWKKVVHNLSVWQRRAVVASMVLGGVPVPDYLKSDADWVTAEVERHRQRKQDA